MKCLVVIPMFLLLLLLLLLLLSLPTTMTAFSVVSRGRQLRLLVRRTCSADNNSFEREFRQKQKTLSNTFHNKDTPNTSQQQQHVEHQTKVFNEMASFFASGEATPPEVVPVLKAMVDSLLSRVIDLRRRANNTTKEKDDEPVSCLALL
jgi:hypothetical protein